MAGTVGIPGGGRIVGAMTDAPNLLGDYLRARRELVSPESLGLPQFGLRRVPGLRREEVAMLSGISADYYLRLEQGRDRNPSRQVLESIARVLRLGDDGTAYLLSLAVGQPRPSRRRQRRETVQPGIRLLIDSLPFPAFVEGRYFDVLASNSLAVAVSPRLAVGGNRMSVLFLDPAEQDLYPDWQQAARWVVAGFREWVGTDVDDPEVVELVGRLSIASPFFRELWARHDVAKYEGAAMSMIHPRVGEIALYREKLAITGSAGQLLVIYHPEPGAHAEKLALLASLTEPGGPSVDLPGAPDPAHLRQ